MYINSLIKTTIIMQFRSIAKDIQFTRNDNTLTENISIIKRIIYKLTFFIQVNKNELRI
jgi:hypothetical protein